jgi:hypothetical protein
MPNALGVIQTLGQGWHDWAGIVLLATQFGHPAIQELTQ